MQQYLEAGKVVTTHGVRGEMKLELWCDGVDFLKKTGRLYASAKGGKCYNIISIRPQGQMALLQLEGVNDIDAARALRGQVFYFDRSDATLPEGRWYVADLIGCEVRDADTGKVYGVVTSVDHPGAQDIYTVKSPSGKEYMFPGVDAFLKERNPPARLYRDLLPSDPGLHPQQAEADRRLPLWRRLRYGALCPAHRRLPARRPERGSGTGTPGPAYRVLDGGRSALHRRARPAAGSVR